MTGRHPGTASALVNPGLALLLAAGLAALTAWIFYPGLMSYDSIYQYRQVIGDLPLHDYQPPIMVYAWKIGNLIAGPGSMMLFHQLLYWSGIVLLATFLHRKLAIRLVLIALLGLLPPLWIHSVTVWNDTGVMASFLFATACTLWLNRSGSKFLFFLALAGLVYGLCARRSALFAAIPLFLCLCDAWYSHAAPASAKFSWWKSARAALALFAGAFLLATLIGRIGVDHMTKWTTVAVWDMAAVSIAEEKVLVPESALRFKDESRSETLTRINESFKPHLNGPLVTAVALFPVDDNEQELLQAWLDLPLHHTGSYLQHRLRVFLGLLGTGNIEQNLRYQRKIQANDFGLKLLNGERPIFEESFRWIRFSAGTPLYKPWVYMLLLLTVLAVPLLRRERLRSFNGRAPLYLGASGLLYVLPLFVLAPATDFRYNLWMIAASCVAVCCVVLVRRQ